MAQTKFLSYDGVAKLISLIKKMFNRQAVTAVNGTGAAVNYATKRTGGYTLTNLNTGATENKTFDYYDTTDARGISTTVGKVDGNNVANVDAALTELKTLAEANKTAVSALGSSSDVVKSVDNAGAVSADSTKAETIAERTGNYTKADGTKGTYKYYDTTYGVAVKPNDPNAPAEMKAGKHGLMSREDKAKLDDAVTKTALADKTSSAQGAGLVGYRGADGTESTVKAALDFVIEGLGDITLEDYVEKTQKVNGKALSGDITLTASDIAGLTATTVDNTLVANADEAISALKTLAEGNKAKIDALKTIKFQITSTLGTTGESNVIYLVPHQHTDDTNLVTPAVNYYDEYIWVNTGTTASPSFRWEKIGSTDVDLSGYWKQADLVAISNDEIDTLWSTTAAAA